jgi:hypothetical protein
LGVKNYDRVLLLLREWIISRCVLARRLEPWLEYHRSRLVTEQALGGLVERNRANRDSVTIIQGALCRVWDRTTDLRNALAHAGMRLAEVALERRAHDIQELVQWCEQHAACDTAWGLGHALAGQSLLITALGLSPGVLFTALRSASKHADWRALVVTSEEAAGKLPEVCERAGWGLSHIQKEIVREPHRCFAEAAGIAARLRGEIAAFSAVTVNVTGGTTAMQYVVERLGRDAERLGLPVRRIALIDDRAPERQQKEPWVAGQVVELESGEAASS